MRFWLAGIRFGKRFSRWPFFQWWHARPLFGFVVFWIAGLSVGNDMTESLQSPNVFVWVLLFVLIIIAFIGLCSRKWMRFFCILFAFCSGCVWMSSSNLWQTSEWSPSQIQTGNLQWQGWLDEAPSIDGDRLSGIALVRPVKMTSDLPFEKVKWSFKLPNERSKQSAANWKRGDGILWSGQISQPDQATNFGGFDARDWARKKDIHWQIRISKSADLPLLIAFNWRELPWLEHPLWSLETVTMRIIDDWRDWTKRQFQETFINYPALAGLLVSMQIGDRSDLLPEWADAYQRFGLTHVLAISGSNVALWVGACLFLLRRFSLTEERIASLTMYSIPFYVAMTGADSSVMRAGCMAMVVLFAKSRNEKLDGMHVLAGCVFVLTLLNPFYLLDIGFQLSVLVTAAIIWFIQTNLTRPAWQQMLMIPIIAQWMTLPHAVFLFHQWSWCSILLNLIVVPIFGFILIPFSLMALMLHFIFPPMITAPVIALVSGAHRCIDFAIQLASTIEKFPQTLATPISATIWWCLYGFLTIQWMQWMNNPQPMLFRKIGMAISVPLAIKRFLLISTVILFGLLTLQPTWFQRTQAFIQGRDLACIRFFDVGQGDAALIRTSSGRIILIDAGPIPFSQAETWRTPKKSFDTGRDILVPLFREMGVHRIDAIVASHQDLDHIGGMRSILSSFPVRELWTNGTQSAKKEVQELFRYAHQQQVVVKPLTAGMSLRVDDSTLVDVLAPMKNWLIDPDDEKQNDLSLVLNVQLNRNMFLFTGDLGAKREDELLIQFRKKKIAPIDVLKVAHHGSKHSTQAHWLSFWTPKIAVVSVGGKNLYHHPHPDLIARIKDAGAIIFRTDRHGELQFSWQNGKLVTRKKNNVQKANDSAFISSR